MKNTIHIVDRFDVPWSGSALEAAAFFKDLREMATVRLWSQGAVHASYGELDVTAIPDTRDTSEIMQGTLLLFGGYFELDGWLEQAQFSRVVLRLNTSPDLALDMVFRVLGRVREATGIEPELAFISPVLRERLGLSGRVILSPIELAELAPASAPLARPFTLGRHSRDVEFKHHEDDPSLYRMLSLQGLSVRVMGGTCLAPHMGADGAQVELLAAGAEPVPTFLQSLDCFFYRNHPSWHEAFGRVIFEAMACALPVVCARGGGYEPWIQHGENGFLFDTQEEAWGIIQSLAGSPTLRSRIGEKAQRSVLTMYDADKRQRARAWFLGAKL
jgi:hypothetical protein